MLTYGKWAHDAVGTMILLARAARSDTPALSGTELGRELRLGASLVAKQMRMLIRAGLVTARRGLHGGYRLARPARGITLFDIVSVFSFERQPARPCKHCQPPFTCPIRESLQEINRASSQRLGSLTLEDCVDSMGACGGIETGSALAATQSSAP